MVGGSTDGKSLEIPVGTLNSQARVTSESQASQQRGEGEPSTAWDPEVQQDGAAW